MAWLFFLMSDPIVFLHGFDTALRWAVISTALLIAVTLPTSLRFPHFPLAALLFLGWAALSATWSIAPASSLQGTWLYAQIAVIGVLVGRNVTAPIVARGLTSGGVAVCLASAYAYWAELPGSYYLATDHFVVTGIGTNENILAYTLVLSLVGAFSLPDPRTWPGRVAVVLSIGLIAYGIFVAGSATGLLCMLLMLAVRAAWPKFVRARPRRRMEALLLSFLAVGLVVVIMRVAFPDAYLGASTFSDRVPFWNATLKTSLDQPIVGYGWSAVWQHPWNPAPYNDVVDRIYDRAGYTLTHGHNNFLDLAPEVGLVGIAIMVALLVGVARRSIPKPGLALPHQLPELSMLTFVALMVFGITEPLLTIPLGWWLLLLVRSVDPAPTLPTGDPPTTDTNSRPVQPGRHRLDVLSRGAVRATA